MSSLFNIILLIAAVSAAIYLLVKKFKNKEPKHIVVIDPEAQRLYKLQKQNAEAKQTLTLEEKVELSWQFLINIKDMVVNKFSKPDQKKVAEAGHMLAQNGMRYEHDVEQEAKIIMNVSKAKKMTKVKEETGRSR